MVATSASSRRARIVLGLDIAASPPRVGRVVTGGPRGAGELGRGVARLDVFHELSTPSLQLANHLRWAGHRFEVQQGDRLTADTVPLCADNTVISIGVVMQDIMSDVCGWR